MLRTFYIAFLSLTLLIAIPARGEEFRMNATCLGSDAEIAKCEDLTIFAYGEIGTGFSDQLAELLAQGAAARRIVVELMSPGGSVGEALAAGRAIRKARAWTMALECASACALTFTGGVVRRLSAGGNLVLHRPSLADTDLARMMDSEIGEQNAALRSTIIDYMQEMGVSTTFAALMYSVPIEGTRIADRWELQDLGVLGADPDYYDSRKAEWLRKYGPVVSEWVSIELQWLSALSRCKQKSDQAEIEGASRWLLDYDAGFCLADWERASGHRKRAETIRASMQVDERDQFIMWDLVHALAGY